MIRTITQSLTQKVEKKYRFAIHAAFYGAILFLHSGGFIPFENYTCTLPERDIQKYFYGSSTPHEPCFRGHPGFTVFS